MLGCKAFKCQDIKGIVHHGTAAVHLTGVLANKTTDQRQRAVFPDDFNGVSVAALFHQGNVCWNINVCRTSTYTRNFSLHIIAA